MKKLRRIFLARAATMLALAVLTTAGAWAQDAVTISTADDWNAFATEVSNGTNDYSGKTVTLGADITVSTMVGTSENKFCGTFNGGGHTLSLSYETAEAYCAPFRYVDGATITGLIVDGTITTTSDHAAGFIGCSDGETTIENSRSSVTINSSVEGDGIHAGFVAETSSGSTTAITGCVFNGSLLGTSTDHCGGFVGLEKGTVSITNCLFAPTACTFGSTDSYTFVRQGTDATVTNSYYTETLGTAQGKKSLSVTSSDEYLTLNSVTPNGGNNISYSVSGISVISSYDYASSTWNPNGFSYNGASYFGSGNIVTLSCTGSRKGYTYKGFEASAGELNHVFLTMPDEDVTIWGLWSKNVIIAYTESGAVGGKVGIYSSKRYADSDSRLSFNEGEAEVPQSDLDADRYIYVGAMPDGIHSLNGIKASDFVVTAGESESIAVVAATYGEGQPIPGRFKFPLPADEDAVVSISFTGAFSYKPMTRTTYIDAAGESQTYDVYVLDGTETSLGHSGYDIPLTYLAQSDLTYSHSLQLESDVNIILGDDKTVIFGSSDSRISPPIILGVDYNLGIYSQSRGENMGKMNLYGYNLGMQVKTLTIGGGDYVVNTYSPCFSVSGDVLITGTGLMKFESYNPAIISTQGNVTVRGGSIDANSSAPCITASNGNVSITEVSSLKLESSGNGAISCSGNLIISGTDDGVVKINDEVTSYSNPVISAGGNISIAAHDVYVGNTNPIALNCTGTSCTVSISADNINLKSNNNAIDAKGDITIADFSTLSVESQNGCGLATTGSITLNGKLVKVNDETTSYNPALSCSGSIIINADELYAGNTTNRNTVNGKSTTITAGKIVVKGFSSVISASDGDVTISGGQVTVATQQTPSISAKNNINLGWTNTSDFILIGNETNQASSYSGTVNIAEGQNFMDEEGTIYSGTLTDDEKKAIGGKKLKPYNPVTLTLAEGQTWTTYYQNDGLVYTLGEGAKAYYVSAVGSDAVTLKPIDNVPSGLPVLISGSDEVTLTPTVGSSAAPTDADVQFQGTAKALEAIPDYAVGRTYVLYHGQFLIADTNSGIAANKCWLTLDVPEVSIDARLSLVINDDATSITSIPTTEGDGNWYDLQGRRLANEPTQHGLYIYKGKKVRK